MLGHWRQVPCGYLQHKRSLGTMQTDLGPEHVLGVTREWQTLLLQLPEPVARCNDNEGRG